MLIHEEAYVSAFSLESERVGEIIHNLLLVPHENDTENTTSVLRAIERACHHRPEKMRYFVQLALDPVIRACWLKDEKDQGLSMLARLRTLNQEMIDNLVLQDEKRGDQLLAQVRGLGDIPNTSLVSGQYLYLPISTQTSIIKVYGAILLDLSTSNSLDEALPKMLRTVQDSIFDYGKVEVKIVTWWKLNYSQTWDNYNRWDISKDIEHKYPEEVAFYTSLYSDFIAKCGTSFFDSFS